MLTLNCKQCAKPFSTYPSKNQRFCSIECGVKGRNTPMYFKKGRTPWNKGLMGYRAGIKHDWMPFGKEHWSYKGDKVQYRALHQWVVNQLGQPSECTHCQKIGYGRKMHWANKSRNYKRKLTDWVRLCAKCHKAYDRNELVLTF